MKAVVKRCAHVGSLLMVGPRLLSFAVRARLFGRDRALNDSMQALSRIPGLRGRYRRAAFLSRALTSCPPTVTIEMGTLLSKAGATFGEHA
jgi:hypothetical protein